MSIGNKTFEGIVWTIGFTIFIKLLSALTQLVLAYFLFPEDFGLLAMTLSITNIASIFAGGQIKTILIQNQNEFYERASQGFWIGLALNILIAIALILISPLAALIYKNDKIIQLMIIIAASIPIRALTIIYSSKLNIELKYKTLTKLHFLEAIILNFTTIILAVLHFGVYSLVIPFILSSTVTAISTRICAGKIKISKPIFSKWKFFLGSFSLLVLYNFILSMQYDGINFFVGIVHGPKITGQFYWGYNLALQAIFVLTLRLKDIFFPTFVKYQNDAENRYLVFRKILVLLTIISVPIFVLQVILASPLIKLLFDQRWYDSIGVVQWISLVIIAKPLNVMLDSILLSMGKFKLLLKLTSMVTVIITSSVIFGSMLGNHISIAKWLSISIFLTGIFQGIYAYKFLGGSISNFIKDNFSIFILILPTAIIAWSVFNIFVILNLYLAIILSIIITLISYLIMIKHFRSAILNELILRLRTVMNLKHL